MMCHTSCEDWSHDKSHLHVQQLLGDPPVPPPRPSNIVVALEGEEVEASSPEPAPLPDLPLPPLPQLPPVLPPAPELALADSTAAAPAPSTR